jgi:pyruvate formate lyase activating enzyme
VGGVLRTLNYAQVSSVNLDPIEKKPIFHFHPGSSILSLGTIGCNLACTFCQNWAISQAAAPTRHMTPERAATVAKEHPENIGIAYTYNEPFVWYEFVLETAQLVKEAGLSNVLVTNGYVMERPLRELLPHIDAVNIDVKSMSERFYRDLCRGSSEPPRRTAEIAKEAGCLVEITNLVIPNWNDSRDEIRSLVDWVVGLGADVPLHFSRYHPDHRLTEPSTPPETLVRARDMAAERLHHVYIGNLWLPGGEDTTCPGCGEVVVERRGFAVSRIAVTDGRCQSCGGEIAIIGT